MQHFKFVNWRIRFLMSRTGYLLQSRHRHFLLAEVWSPNLFSCLDKNSPKKDFSNRPHLTLRFRFVILLFIFILSLEYKNRILVNTIIDKWLHINVNQGKFSDFCYQNMDNWLYKIRYFSRLSNIHMASSYHEQLHFGQLQPISLISFTFFVVSSLRTS